jgi:membrane protein implicated in regulation of membrane protease activity
MEPQYWWLIAGIALFLVEIFTPGFFAASLGIGAFSAAIAAWVGANLEVQLLIFSLVSVISIIILRPIIKKHLEAKDVRTNADAMIGRIGTVVQVVDKKTGQGRMALDGDEWQFVLSDATANPAKGDQVRVLERNSIVLTVESIK